MGTLIHATQEAWFYIKTFYTLASQTDWFTIDEMKNTFRDISKIHPSNNENGRF